MYRCTKHHCSLLEFLNEDLLSWVRRPATKQGNRNVVYRFTELFSYTEKKKQGKRFTRDEGKPELL